MRNNCGKCLKTAVFKQSESKVEEISNELNSKKGAWFIQSLVKVVRKWMERVGSDAVITLIKEIFG